MHTFSLKCIFLFPLEIRWEAGGRAHAYSLITLPKLVSVLKRPSSEAPLLLSKEVCGILVKHSVHSVKHV